MKRLAALLFLAGCLNQIDETLPAPAVTNERSPSAPAPAAAVTITGLLGPESVLYDPQQDVYFISNINGGLTEMDGNGFISRVRADTLAVDKQWVTGLDAPKGMAILGDALYVSDVRAVRKFDRRTGKSLGFIALPGATLINDIATDGKSLYVSDTGITPGTGIRFHATGTDAIWQITNDAPSKLADGVALNQPNGLDWYDGALWVASFRGNEIYRLDGGKKRDVQKLPRGQLDGLLHLPDGRAVVTSWVGQAVYAGEDGKFEPLLKAIAAPADIGFDTKRHRLLVPRSATNEVTIHPMG